MNSEKSSHDGAPATPVYSQGDWKEDWEWLAKKQNEALQLRPPIFDWRQAVYYFDRRHGVRADYRRDRLLAAWRYVLNHIGELNVGRFAIESKERAVIGPTLLSALCLIYRDRTDTQLRDEPSAEAVLELARELERRIS